MTGLAELLQSQLVQTVLAGAALLGVAGGVLGAFAVLRRQSLMGDTLSHAALPGVCIGFLVAGGRDLGSILAGAFFSGALAALVVLLIVRTTRLKTDAALGIALSVFFAAGIVLLTVVQRQGGASQMGLSTFLFGQAAAILRADLWILGGVTLGALVLIVAFWKEFKIISFDPDFARALGLPVLLLEILLTVMIAMAIVVGLQMVGVVLMVAMLIAPAVAARQWVQGLGAMVVLSAVFGAASGVLGALVSAQARGLATGPVVVLVASGIVLVSLLVAPGRGLIWRAIETRKQAQRLGGDHVLLTLHGLSAAHADPAYPSERGMIDAFHGTTSQRALARLEARGLVRSVQHPPETTAHWELTDAGRSSAQDTLQRISNNQTPAKAPE